MRQRTVEQLWEKVAEYRGIFEATNDALIITDLDGFCVEANPAACRMYGYTYEEMIGLNAAMATHPDYHELAREFVEAINAGGSMTAESFALRKDGTPFPIESRASRFIFRGTLHILAVVRDITDRMQAAEQVREKEAQYRGIFEATNDGLIIGDLEGHIVEANPAYCQIFGYTHDELIGREIRQLTAPEDRHTIAAALRELDAGGTYQAVVKGMRKDGSTFYADVRAVHFTYRGKAHSLSVVQDVTERVRAYELLEQRVEERTRELSTLLEVSHNVASTLEIKPLLGLILDQLNLVADNDGITLLEVRGDEFVVLLRRAPGLEDQTFPSSYSAQSHGPIWDKLRRGEVAIIGDVRGDDPLARAYRKTVGDFLDTSLSFENSFMAVPLMLKDRIIGLLGLSSARTDYYTPHHAAVALAIAQQAAIAMENARLYQKAQEVAVLEERQRLSRELHDSVSQALYSIALGSKTAQALLDPDSRAVEPVEFVLAQAERGLAEMRALIFELRPEALEQEGLAAALQRQAGALRARQQLAITMLLCEEPEAPLPVKEALYRIAQEALHNTAKHGRATTVEVRLEESACTLTLEVRDDGAGFDAAESFPGHLGLHTMRERAARLGGALEVASAPGAGTSIRAQIPLPARSRD